MNALELIAIANTLVAGDKGPLATDERQTYEDCIISTSTASAPWCVVPADEKKNAGLIVSKVVLDTLHDRKTAYPKNTAKRRQELKFIRKQI